MPRYTPVIRPNDGPIRAVLLGPMTEIRLHRRGYRDGGSFPCLGSVCEYAVRDVCTRQTFIRWHGCAAILKEEIVYPSAEAQAEYARLRRIGEPANPDMIRARRVYACAGPAVAELYDHEVDVLGVDPESEAARGVALEWRSVKGGRDVHKLGPGMREDRMPPAFDLEAALERIYGMPVRVHGAPAESAAILKFRRKIG